MMMGRYTISAATTGNKNAVGEIDVIRFGTDALAAPIAYSQANWKPIRSSKASIFDSAQFPEGTTTDSTDDQAGLLTSGLAFDHAFPQFQESQWQM